MPGVVVYGLCRRCRSPLAQCARPNDFAEWVVLLSERLGTHRAKERPTAATSLGLDPFGYEIPIPAGPINASPQVAKVEMMLNDSDSAATRRKIVEMSKRSGEDARSAAVASEPRLRWADERLPSLVSQPFHVAC